MTQQTFRKHIFLCSKRQDEDEEDLKPIKYVLCKHHINTPSTWKQQDFSAKLRNNCGVK